MNVTIKKPEMAGADQSRPPCSSTDFVSSPEPVCEAVSDEVTDRKLYRRSVAYFFFGFGYDKNLIITDEP